MSKKTCDAFFCNNKTPKKFRYCYDCAKSKGLTGSKTNWLGAIMFVIILLVVFG